MSKTIPLRQCIACRELFPKRDMLRIVKNSDGKIFIDYTSKASGRGAYICNSADCIKKLRRQRLLNKVFSCAVEEEIYTAIEEDYFAKEQD